MRRRSWGFAREVEEGVGLLGGLIGPRRSMSSAVDLDRQAGRQAVGLPLRTVGEDHPSRGHRLRGPRDNRAEEWL